MDPGQNHIIISSDQVPEKGRARAYLSGKGEPYKMDFRDSPEKSDKTTKLSKGGSAAASKRKKTVALKNPSREDVFVGDDDDWGSEQDCIEEEEIEEIQPPRRTTVVSKQKEVRAPLSVSNEERIEKCRQALQLCRQQVNYSHCWSSPIASCLSS